MLKSGETSTAAAAASAAEIANVDQRDLLDVHAHHRAGLAVLRHRAHGPPGPRAGHEPLEADEDDEAGGEHERAAARPARTPPTLEDGDDSAVGTSLGWVPKTRMARLVSMIEVASVAMSCTCQERGRMARITVRS